MPGGHYVDVRLSRFLVWLCKFQLEKQADDFFPVILMGSDAHQAFLDPGMRQPVFFHDSLVYYDATLEPREVRMNDAGGNWETREMPEDVPDSGLARVAAAA